MMVMVCCTGKLQVIVEFCGRGNLLHYLRSKRTDTADPFMPKRLLAMAHQVAQGMEYLASKKVCPEEKVPAKWLGTCSLCILSLCVL